MAPKKRACRARKRCETRTLRDALSVCIFWRWSSTGGERMKRRPELRLLSWEKNREGAKRHNTHKVNCCEIFSWKTSFRVNDTNKNESRNNITFMQIDSPFCRLLVANRTEVILWLFSWKIFFLLVRRQKLNCRLL